MQSADLFHSVRCYGLPRGLKRGAWLELGERDINALMQASTVTDSYQKVRDDAPAAA